MHLGPVMIMQILDHVPPQVRKLRIVGMSSQRCNPSKVLKERPTSKQYATHKQQW